MAERIYPSAKPPSTAAAPAINGAGATTARAFPPTKAQQYGATRPIYRPQPPRRRRFCTRCCCCIWCVIFILLLILIAIAAGGVFWLLYRPQRPYFTVDSLRVSQFNLTSSSRLNSKINLTISSRNPNRKIRFHFDPISVVVTSSGAVICNGSFPGFDHGPKNVTILKSTLGSFAGQIDGSSAGLIRSDLKKKKGLALVVELETKVRVKVGGLRTKKVRVRVLCDGIHAGVPSGKSSPARAASTSGAKCKADIRIKVWKWSI